ncbi:uncharacterized protein EI90DRAFT_3282142 [Cantharellus anzutake]|uniref:uncharacterized protein n=1 Tax=Cantharellus anzutake TaxID=1750568 RepID=UPI0019030561|nr:uncharacterized protein EI90DRAFT_3282142 [Cantharellus anzutake]KAF8323003.1 hypothetical protein EI90DRAFT_3282142 [Cantharellus anzutake]
MAAASVGSLSTSLSASVTRILSLTGFSPELKTKDIQNAFYEWESQAGGFKIKWVDDTSLLLVFADAGVAKRAYLQSLLNPPPTLSSSTSPDSLRVRPYDGPDAQAVIYTVNNRRNNNTRGSVSAPANSHSRSISVSGAGKSGGWKSNNGAGLAGSMHAPGASGSGNSSPTLPNLATQPTLNSLISSSLNMGSSDSIGISVSLENGTIASQGHDSAPPRFGDPARRMVGAALGVRHPGIAPKGTPERRGNGINSGDIRSLGNAMGGLVIAE